MNKIECESCIKRKTIYCPNSEKCFATKDKPFYQNRIMLLEENQELKKKINTYENPEDLTLMFMYCDEKEKDKIKCLEQENQQLKKQLERSEKARKEAIKYVKKTSGYDNPYNDTFLNTYAVDNLLEILDIDKGE